jgi:hypothetical protein
MSVHHDWMTIVFTYLRPIECQRLFRIVRVDQRLITFFIKHIIQHLGWSNHDLSIDCAKNRFLSGAYCQECGSIIRTESRHSDFPHLFDLNESLCNDDYITHGTMKKIFKSTLLDFTRHSFLNHCQLPSVSTRFGKKFYHHSHVRYRNQINLCIRNVRHNIDKEYAFPYKKSEIFTHEQLQKILVEYKIKIKDISNKRKRYQEQLEDQFAQSFKKRRIY